jgi:hypothetical protein
MKISKIISKAALKLERSYWFLLFAIVFKLSLDFSYVNFVVPVFAYEGYFYEMNLLSYIESWVIFFVLIYVSPKILMKPSDYLVNFLLFSFLCPLLVFYGLSGADRQTLYIVISSVFLIYAFRNGKPINVMYIKSGQNIVYAILFLGIIGVTVWMFASGGLRYFNLDLTLVYDFRRDVGAVINQGVMGYFNVWATKIFGPVLLALALWRKNYLLAAFVFGLHVIWFGISSHKSVLFYPFLVTFLWAWFRKTRALSLIPLAMSLAVTAAFLLYIFYEEIFFGSMFIRRVFFVPAKLTFDYHEFFSVNPFVYWSNSITYYFIDYPYTMNTALLIGDYLGTDASANNSFLATGYMHAGIPGMIFYGVLVGLLFRLIDSLARNGVAVWVAVATMIVPSQALLTSADLPTALLTHGIGMSLVILFLLRSEFRRPTPQ